MEKFRLSFASINIISGNIVEIIIDNNITVSLEMTEELDKFLINAFDSSFGLLINKINHYSYSFEATLNFASLEEIHAIAVINYSKDGEKVTDDVMARRKVDQLNIKSFSGLDLGYRYAISWLNNELSIKTR